MAVILVGVNSATLPVDPNGKSSKSKSGFSLFKSNKPNNAFSVQDLTVNNSQVSATSSPNLASLQAVPTERVSSAISSNPDSHRFPRDSARFVPNLKESSESPRLHASNITKSQSVSALVADLSTGSPKSPAGKNSGGNSKVPTWENEKATTGHRVHSSDFFGKDQAKSSPLKAVTMPFTSSSPTEDCLIHCKCHSFACSLSMSLSPLLARFLLLLCDQTQLP